MSSNRALWQDKSGIPGVVREGTIPSEVPADEILIKVHAWGINPADHMVQDVALPFITYPLILGEDIAGVVEAVGSAAAPKFEVGDRVVGMALGAVNFKPGHGAFQEHVVLDATFSCKIPDSLPFTDAAVLPLCLMTAAHGLFSKDYLGLPLPSIDPTSTGKSILVWSGSSGVGSNAIQLAKAAGFRVIATCSPHNFDHVKSLGAEVVFDYNDPSAIDQIVTELDKGDCAGIYHAAGPSAPSCQVARKSKQDFLVASTNLIQEEDASGIRAKMIFASGGAVHYEEAKRATFDEFLPEALSRGLYKISPVPEVISTKGVEGIQEGLDILRKGVSAKKIVVENI
ncbi:hypothetical protein ACHAPJ_009307 [Fusarium lateritium]